MELVTICVALYNNEKYITRCLSSIQNQKYKSLQVIVVNDGSTDNSISAINDYLNDNRFVLVNKKNEGLSSTRQCGLELAKGSFVCFVDGDDCLSEDYVENFVFEMNRHNLDICVCGTKFLDSNGTELIEFSRLFSYRDDSAIYELNPELIKNKYAFLTSYFLASDSWNKMYRLSYLRKNNLYFEHPKGMNGSDLFFNYRALLYLPRINTIKQCNYLHYIYNNSCVHQKKDNLHKAMQIIVEKLMKESKSLFMSKELDAQMGLIYIKMFFYVLRDVSLYSTSVKSDLKKETKSFYLYVNSHDISCRVSRFNSVSVNGFIFLVRLNNFRLLYFFVLLRMFFIKIK